MLSPSPSLHTSALATGTAERTRKPLLLKLTTPSDAAIEHAPCFGFDPRHHTVAEDAESAEFARLEPPGENTVSTDACIKSHSEAVAVVYVPDKAVETEQQTYQAQPWLDKPHTPDQPWLVPGLLCGVAAGASGGSSGSGSAAANAPAMTPTPGWSAVSGWGQPNVAHALAMVKGAAYIPAISQTGTHSYLDDMGFTTAWSQGYTGKGVVIADIDTGFDFNNPYLTANMHFSTQCWNFVNDSANVQDDNGHGTMTASEMCAGPGTGFGITGGAYDAELMVLKALDANGQGSSSQVSSAIYFAVDHGASVINLSLGQNNPDSLIHNALSYAQAHDVVVVAAAGNSAANQPCYPAAYATVMPHVIAVGATQGSSLPGTLASFSNQAGSSQSYNFVTAPGEHLTGFGTDGQLWSWSGTSMAAPLVTAQAALLASALASQHARDIVQSIMESADALEIMFGGPAVSVDSGLSLGSADAFQYEKSVFVEDSKFKLSALPFDHMY
jgi:subtilisin family serine protease